jgi:hypothetical protein
MHHALHRSQQSSNVVRHWFARLLCYYFLAFGLGVAAAQAPGSGFESEPPTEWLGCSGTVCRSYGSALSAGTGSCQMTSLSYQNSISYELRNFGLQNESCRVTRLIADTVGMTETVTAGIFVTPVCAGGFTWDAITPDGNKYTGSCKRKACVTSTLTCYFKSNTAMDSVPLAACEEGCVIAQSLGNEEERFEAGIQKFYYAITKVRTATRCYVAGGGAVSVSCNSGAPKEQNPCELPDAVNNPACGGGTGCGAGYVEVGSGACAPDANNDGVPDGDNECVAGTYRPNGTGSCVPFPCPEGQSRDGSGICRAPPGDGDGDPGDGGGTGGGDGSGSGYKGECGPGKVLCENTFREYWDMVKDFVKGDATEEAAGKAAIQASRSGAFNENPLNKGMVIDVSNLQLNTNSFFPAGCPAPRSISVLGGGITLEYTAICDFAMLIAPLVLVLAGMFSARVIFNSWS